jgi:S-adenosylmethionine synthetase
MGAERISVTRRAPYRPAVEVVERKGSGHPDTLCDHLAERLAVRISAAHLAASGTLHHFNVDKALLAAGAVDVGFGGGQILRPSELIVAGRADLLGGAVDIADLLAGLRSDLAAALPDAAPDAFDVDLRLQPPSPELAHLVVASADDGAPRANDTSVAVVSLPRSPLEEAVYRVERCLTSDTFRQTVPVGPDVKVMGCRVGESVELVVAAAVLAGGVSDIDDYQAVIATIAGDAAMVAEEVLGAPAPIRVNAADRGHPYLTLCGSSAEAGDDGQVGRGNRFGGLITPFRAMSLEACAGKNPMSHVGKTYHAVAHDICQDVLAVAGAAEVTVTLLSRIGNPVTRPQLASIAVVGDVDPVTVRHIVDARLVDWRGVRDRLLAGHYLLF